MKRKWKKILVSGLGGLLVGAAAVVVTKRKRKPGKVEIERIPEPVKKVQVETEPRELLYREEPYVSSTLYTCAPTSFKVWSFLRKTASKSGPVESQRIYYITSKIHFRSLQKADQKETLTGEKFYATIHGCSPSPRRMLPDHIVRGQHLEFRKCHVGGSMNGVETGDRIITTPVLRYEIQL